MTGCSASSFRICWVIIASFDGTSDPCSARSRMRLVDTALTPFAPLVHIPFPGEHAEAPFSDQVGIIDRPFLFSYQFEFPDKRVQLADGPDRDKDLPPGTLRENSRRPRSTSRCRSAHRSWRSRPPVRTVPPAPASRAGTGGRTRTGNRRPSDPSYTLCSGLFFILPRQNLYHMAIHPIEFRYGTPEMRAVWGEERRFAAIVAAEVALARAEADVGMIPPDAAEVIGERGRGLARTREGDRGRDPPRHDGGREGDRRGVRRCRGVRPLRRDLKRHARHGDRTPDQGRPCPAR